MRCPSCDSEILLGSARCDRCGTDLSSVEAAPEDDGPVADSSMYGKPLFSAPAPRGPSLPAVLPWTIHEEGKSKSAISLFGVAVVLIGGLMSMVQGTVILAAASPAVGIPFIGDLGTSPWCGSLEALFGLLAVAGGVFGIARSQWGIALLGAFFCFLSAGWFFISSFLGLVGLILIAAAKEEFD